MERVAMILKYFPTGVGIFSRRTPKEFSDITTYATAIAGAAL
jgi:hypothetical protein